VNSECYFVCWKIVVLRNFSSFTIDYSLFTIDYSLLPSRNKEQKVKQQNNYNIQGDGLFHKHDGWCTYYA
jgi:hypothetical protein